MPIDPEADERGLYVARARRASTGIAARARHALRAAPRRRRDPALRRRRPRDAAAAARALDGPRHVCWNFVSSRRDRINQAKEDWKAGRFALPPDDHDEFIPLPEVPLTVSYP